MENQIDVKKHVKRNIDQIYINRSEYTLVLYKYIV